MSSGSPRPTYLDPIGLNAGQRLERPRPGRSRRSSSESRSLFREIVDTPRITLRSPAEPIRVENRNALVLEEPFVDGIKTGTTVEAGYVLVASGTQKGIGLVSVVLGSPGRGIPGLGHAGAYSNTDSRFTAIDRSSRRASAWALPASPRAGGFPLAAAEPVTEVARADQEVDVRLSETAPVAPPVAEGEPVAVAVVRLDGQKVGEVDALAVRAVAGLPEPEQNDTGLPAWAWIVFGAAAAMALLFALLAIRVHRRE